MPFDLHEVEVRVLGALIEKDMATPEYYPLSLNALLNACNQKSNREPVVSYDDGTVSDALQLLRNRKLAFVQTGDRVPKYGHRASETLNVNNRELALLCVLMLRGAQTVGELKTRSERMHAFDDLDAVESVLRHLGDKELVVQLPRQTGTREARWAHLLCGEPILTEAPPQAYAVVAHAGASNNDALVHRVAALESEVAELRAQFAEFKKQFE
jgi:uncharacterized protein YceH (UPF0502 family)